MPFHIVKMAKKMIVKMEVDTILATSNNTGLKPVSAIYGFIKYFNQFYNNPTVYNDYVSMKTQC